MPDRGTSVGNDRQHNKGGSGAGGRWKARVHSVCVPLVTPTPYLAPLPSAMPFSSQTKFIKVLLSQHLCKLAHTAGDRLETKKSLWSSKIIFLTSTTLYPTWYPDAREGEGGEREKSALYTLHVHALNLDMWLCSECHYISGCGYTMPMP